MMTWGGECSGKNCGETGAVGQVIGGPGTKGEEKIMAGGEGGGSTGGGGGTTTMRGKIIVSMAG